MTTRARGSYGKAFLAPEKAAAWAKTAKDGYLLEAPDPTSLGVPADHPDAPWLKRHLTPHFLPALAIRSGRGRPSTRATM